MMEIQDWVIRQPAMVVNPMICRRGMTGPVQGQPIPNCDGILEPSRLGQRDALSCSKCGLTHATLLVNGVLHYGAVL